jgi:hypothetical protein
VTLALLALVAVGVGQFVNDMIPSLKLAHLSLGYDLPAHTPNPFKRSHTDMNRLVLFNRYFAKTDGAGVAIWYFVSVPADSNVISATDPTSPLARFSAHRFCDQSKS